MPTTKLLLVTGVELDVQGSMEEVAKALENAARSSPGTLAWLETTPDQPRLGVNPAHVMTVTSGDG
jgi:hypothetical protein